MTGATNNHYHFYYNAMHEGVAHIH